jgi:hypothetical protein
MALRNPARLVNLLVLATVVVAALASVYGASASSGGTTYKPIASRSFDASTAPEAAGVGVTDGRSPDTRDAADAAQLQVVDGRSPDTLEATMQTQPVEIVYSGGFDWSDAGVGAGAAAGLIGALMTSLFLVRRPDGGRTRAA